MKLYLIKQNNSIHTNKFMKHSTGSPIIYRPNKLKKFTKKGYFISNNILFNNSATGVTHRGPRSISPDEEEESL